MNHMKIKFANNLRLAVEPDSESVRPSSPFTALRERSMSSGSRRTHDDRRRSVRRLQTSGLPSENMSPEKRRKCFSRDDYVLNGLCCNVLKRKVSQMAEYPRTYRFA